MELVEKILYKNECFKANRKHNVRGIMLHSTGTNQVRLSVWYRLFNALRPRNRQVCAHAFIGCDDDRQVKTMQTLPWDTVGWHSGSGFLGWSKNANNSGYIGIEMCEDDLLDAEYFKKLYFEALELCAHLCRKYNLCEKDVICHAEGHRKGIASNHADVEHWFSRHGKTMDAFRAELGALLEEGQYDADTNQKKLFCVGDKVRLIRFTDDTKLRAYTYTGGVFRVYYDIYNVIGVKGDRVVIGQNNIVSAAVSALDLEKEMK